MTRLYRSEERKRFPSFLRSEAITLDIETSMSIDMEVLRLALSSCLGEGRREAWDEGESAGRCVRSSFLCYRILSNFGEQVFIISSIRETKRYHPISSVLLSEVS